MFHLLDSAVRRLAITRCARGKPTYQKWPIASEAYMAWLPRLTHQRTTTTCEEPFLVVHCTGHWASRHGCDEFRWRSVRMCGVVVHGGVLNRRNEPHPVIIAKPLHTTVKSNHKDHRGTQRKLAISTRCSSGYSVVHSGTRTSPSYSSTLVVRKNRRTYESPNGYVHAERARVINFTTDVAAHLGSTLTGKVHLLRRVCLADNSNTTSPSGLVTVIVHST